MKDKEDWSPGLLLLMSQERRTNSWNMLLQILYIGSKIKLQYMSSINTL